MAALPAPVAAAEARQPKAHLPAAIPYSKLKHSKIKNSLLILLLGLFVLTACTREEAFHAQLKLLPDFGVAQLQADSLASLLESDEELLLLDTRSPQEWGISRLPGATVLDVEGFSVAQLDTVPANRTIILYCSVGYRSGEVGKQLKEKGFLRVYNLYGGILAWKNLVYPLLTPEGKPTDRVHTYNSYWAKFLEKGEAVY